MEKYLWQILAIFKLELLDVLDVSLFDYLFTTNLLK